MGTPSALLCLAAAVALCLPLPSGAQEIPRLEKKGTATQLIVDGRPFLMLAGELHNSSASSLDYMRPIWGKLVKLNLNTVLATVSWELVEPQEGKYDFALVDGLIQEARRNNLKLVFLWFGSWKNGVSTYVPMWVKTDQKRFSRVRSAKGINMDVVTPLSAAARDADARAYAALMRHIKEVDGREHTVIMMQVENEVGLLGESRDRSPLAEAEWAKPVPSRLLDYLQKNRSSLIPEMAAIWGAAGMKTSGTWAEVFGTSPDADEVFMAWHYAQFMGKMVSEGKAAYPLPMYVNAWLVQHPGQVPGRYPSGGPVSKMLDVWRAAAPQIDLLAPDIYLPDFKGVLASYTRSGNPLFIPEASRGPEAAANVFYAVGQHNALGFAPFGIDSVEENHPLAGSYEVLRQLAPVLAEHAGQGKTAGILDTGDEYEAMTLGNYQLRIRFERRGSETPHRELKGRGLIIATGPDEYLAAGSGYQVSFTPATPGPGIARIGYIDEGRFVDGKWTPGRRMNGDENGGGSSLRFPRGEVLIQKIRLYRHD